jgi:hypothetical protein
VLRAEFHSLIKLFAAPLCGLEVGETLPIIPFNRKIRVISADRLLRVFVQIALPERTGSARARLFQIEMPTM